jgi:GNAT superfamily N-acetyltransferase
VPQQLTIRRAVAGDTNLVLTLLRELAEYERLTEKFFLTPETVSRDFLGSGAAVFCDLASVEDEPVGLATWYWTYATFASARGLYLEDLYVREKWRGHGFGKTLMAHLAHQAMQHGANHIKWSVLNWNEPSIEFYEGIGAEPESAWTVYALAGDPLKRLAQA